MDFSKSIQISNFMNIHPVGLSYSMRTDGQTDIHDDANSCLLVTMLQTCLKTIKK